jgi:hypothetical protein
MWRSGRATSVWRALFRELWETDLVIKHACLLTLFATLLSLPGCSVDESRNVQRKNREECMKAGGEPITDHYCDLNPEAGVKDAAVRDASVDDDAGADAKDAGPIPCMKDEELTCYTQSQVTYQQQPCRPGVRKCIDGLFGKCEGEIKPEQESCNGADDDCDGTADEMPGSASECQVEDRLGECARGKQVCDNGQPKCWQVNGPQTDMCDGFDNDCDGETDEGTAVVCYPDDATGCTENEAGEFDCFGTCRTGTKSCTDGAYEEACGGDRVAPAEGDVCPSVGEISGDEDCDGKVDEGCGCIDGNPCYTGMTGTKDVGPCHAGTWDCSDETHGDCVDEVIQEPETCANPDVDNDCDGTVDDIPMLDTSCTAQSTGMGVCKTEARWQCRDGVRTCVDGPMGAEVCDALNIDENCNGMSNEIFALDTDEENCGGCGVVCAQGLQCCGGRCVNTQASNDHCSICGNDCAAGETCCSGGCINTLSSASNCGRCGNMCTGLLNSCSAGSCKALLGN